MFAFLLRRLSLALLLVCLASPFAQAVTSFYYADVVVYGDSPAAYTAAIQLAESRHDVLLVSPVAHVGGMMIEGLGSQDVDSRSGSGEPIGGLAAEFYLRVARVYSPSTNTPKYDFEAKVAQSVIDSWLIEKGVRQLRSARLSEAPGAIRKQGARITELTLEDGTRVAGRVFIDATVEGDLMAFAGVSCTWGRESNSQYGESANGVRVPSGVMQYSTNVDPYVVPGNPSSGTIVGVQNEAPGVNGQGDLASMGFCLRLPLTKNPANKIPITAPAGYTTNDYELYRRYFAAGGMNDWLNGPGAINASTTTKLFDLGSWHDLSGNLYGRNFGYPDGTYAERAAIYEEHRRFTQGLIHYLSTNPDVPIAVRNEWSRWGLCADEFTDNGGWPRRLYVRAARRMVSDYVITEANVRRSPTGGVVPAAEVVDPIGVCYWPIDLHPARTLIRNGKVYNEGGYYGTDNYRPFGIACRAIVPKRAECTNLLVPAALSSSYVAYGAVRLEWTFMVLGQSAAAAAGLALDQNLAVQDVPYAQLRTVLLAKKQKVTIAATDPSASLGEVIVDNDDVSGVALTGSWTTSTTKSGYYGDDYLHDGDTGKGTKSIRFTPDLPTTGSYVVYARWNSDAARANAVPFDITHAGGTTTVTVNQQLNGSNAWNLLGTYSFSAGSGGSVLIRNDGTVGYVIADAVRFIPAESPSLTPIVNIASAQGTATERGLAQGRLVVTRSGDTSASLVVNLSIAGTATAGTDYTALPTTVSFPAGISTSTFSVVPLSDTSVEGTESVLVTVVSGSGYANGESGTATVRILDTPFDAWRHAHGLSASGGPMDDANRNGIADLLDFVHDGPDGVPRAGIDDVPATMDFNFWRRRDLGGVTLTPLVSPNLTDWSNASAPEEILAYDPTTDRLHVRYTLPLPESATRFFARLKGIP